MGLGLLESGIIEPPRSRRRNRNVSETPLPAIIWSAVTECPGQEKVAVVVVVVLVASRDPSFHVSQRGQPIIFLNETLPSCITQRLHDINKCVVLFYVPKTLFFPLGLLYKCWNLSGFSERNRERERGGDGSVEGIEIIKRVGDERERERGSAINNGRFRRIRANESIGWKYLHL